jgi:hypothetical protein
MGLRRIELNPQTDDFFMDTGMFNISIHNEGNLTYRVNPSDVTVLPHSQNPPFFPHLFYFLFIFIYLLLNNKYINFFFSNSSHGKKKSTPNSQQAVTLPSPFLSMVKPFKNMEVTEKMHFTRLQWK